MRKTIVLHVGYPKTATTTLQKHVFPNLKKINYLGKFYDGQATSLLDKETIARIGLSGGPDGLPQDKRFSEILAKSLDDRPALISEERIIGSTFTPRFYDGKRYELSTAVSAAKDIYELFDPERFEVKILITLRRQDDALASKYAQSFLKSYSKIPDLDNFDKFIDDILSNSDSFIRHGYNFLETCSAFEKRFGQQNMLVLPYELFKEDSKKFMESIFSYAGTDSEEIVDTGRRENVRSAGEGKRHSMRSAYHLLSDIKRALFPDIKIPLGKKLVKALKKTALPKQKDPGYIHMNNETANKILSLYDDSNRELDEKFDLNLKKYGYY